VPDGQLTVQLPLTQASDPVQSLPQLPQFAGSMSVSAHAPEHSSRPEEQLHRRDEHSWSARQAVPHAPQLRGSVSSVTQ